MNHRIKHFFVIFALIVGVLSIGFASSKTDGSSSINKLRSLCDNTLGIGELAAARFALEEELINAMKLMPQADRIKLIEDFIGQDVSSTQFRAGVKEAGELTAGEARAWKGLIDADDWARLNTRLLEKISGESDVFIEKVGEFYKTTMKNNTPAGFNGAGPYTHGVIFDDFGFPDFKPFNPIGNQHIIPNGVGNRATDFKAAKQWLKNKPEIEDYLDLSADQISGSPFKVKINGQWSEQMTWHHHENGKDLVPVLSDIHNTTKHVGG